MPKTYVAVVQSKREERRRLGQMGSELETGRIEIENQIKPKVCLTQGNQNARQLSRLLRSYFNKPNPSSASSRRLFGSLKYIWAEKGKWTDHIGPSNTKKGLAGSDRNGFGRKRAILVGLWIICLELSQCFWQTWICGITWYFWAPYELRLMESTPVLHFLY